MLCEKQGLYQLLKLTVAEREGLSATKKKRHVISELGYHPRELVYHYCVSIATVVLRLVTLANRPKAPLPHRNDLFSPTGASIEIRFSARRWRGHETGAGESADLAVSEIARSPPTGQ